MHDEISKYEHGNASYLNRVIYIHVFKPDEINFEPYCAHLIQFEKWLIMQDFDFNETSENLKKLIKAVFGGNSTKISGTRGYKSLDNLIEIDGVKIAIEIEASNNISNGYLNLVESIKQNMASFGMMIVSWTAKRSGQADEANALSALDQLSEYTDGKYPVVRLAIIRDLDIINIMKERYK